MNHFTVAGGLLSRLLIIIVVLNLSLSAIAPLTDSSLTVDTSSIFSQSSAQSAMDALKASFSNIVANQTQPTFTE
jgi:hypothetical protein